MGLGPVGGFQQIQLNFLRASNKMDPNGKKLLQFSHFHGPAACFHGFSLKIQNRHTTPRPGEASLSLEFLPARESPPGGGRG